MKLSYWEKKSWFTDVDYCVVGSGIVGLNCALHLKLKHPKAKVLVLERGILPLGASTKNAGFACFGSVSELLADLKNQSQDEVIELVRQRKNGLELLRRTLGDKNMDYQQHGGYEVFLKEDKHLYEECISKIKDINILLKTVFKDEVFNTTSNRFNFKNIQPNLIFNKFEGQIDVGKMMQSLLQKVRSLGVMILNSIEVLNFQSQTSSVNIQLKDFEFTSKKLFLATNAFAKQLLNVNLQPARNQVLITKPINNLNIKGTFHLHEGYYYFRNIDNRILIGGGRHLDKTAETTNVFGTTDNILNPLQDLLTEIVLPNTDFTIEQAWSGILGVGNTKSPIVQQIQNNVFCGVRLGGMGVAIGSEVGKKLASFV